MLSLTKVLYVVKFYYQCIMYYLQLSDWRYSILSKVPFHLLHIKKLLLKPCIFLRFYHGQEIICTPPPILAHLTQSLCHHFTSVVRPSTINKISSPLKPPGQFRPNVGGIVLGRLTSKIMSGNPNLQPTWPLLLKIKKGDAIF